METLNIIHDTGVDHPPTTTISSTSTRPQTPRSPRSISKSTNYLISFINFFRYSIQYEIKEDGSKGSILGYDNDYAITIGWLVPRKGSVFSIFEQIIVLGISVMICCLLAYGSCINLNRSDSCIALPSADTSYLTLTTLCSFTVAFFANSVLERWWAIRKHMQMLMGAGYELVIIFSGILSSDVKDAETPEKKAAIRQEKEKLMHSIIGLLVLNFRLLFNAARGNTDISDLVKRNLISKDEHDYFVSMNATSIHVCAIMLNYIQESARKGLIGQEHGVSEANMQLLQNCVLTVRSNASSVTMYINVQMPYPFIQIISAVTYMFIIQLTLVCSAFIAQGMANNTNADITTGVLTICLYNFVLLGLLRLFEVLSNPLGDDAADFPGDTYMKTFEEDLKSVAVSTFALIDNNGITGVSRNSFVLSENISKDKSRSLLIH